MSHEAGWKGEGRGRRKEQVSGMKHKAKITSCSTSQVSSKYDRNDVNRRHPIMFTPSPTGCTEDWVSVRDSFLSGGKT
jgi:hypothetical protein